MKKSCNIIKISTYVFLCLFIILFSKQLVHADVIEDSRNGVVPDKVWSVNYADTFIMRDSPELDLVTQY